MVEWSERGNADYIEDKEDHKPRNVSDLWKLQKAREHIFLWKV